MISSQVSPLVNEFDSGAEYHHGHETVSLDESDIALVEEVINEDKNVDIEIIDIAGGSKYVKVSGGSNVTKSVSPIIDITATDNDTESFTNAGKSLVLRPKSALAKTDIIGSSDVSNFQSPFQQTGKISKPPVAKVNESVRFVSKFPSANKRKVNFDVDSEFASTKKARLDEKSRYEDELVEMKRNNFLKQSRLLDLQIETAELEREAAVLGKEAALLDVKIKERQLQHSYSPAA